MEALVGPQGLATAFIFLRSSHAVHMHPSSRFRLSAFHRKSSMYVILCSGQTPVPSGLGFSP
jgi:hypothetical protein